MGLCQAKELTALETAWREREKTDVPTEAANIAELLASANHQIDGNQTPLNPEVTKMVGNINTEMSRMSAGGHIAPQDMVEAAMETIGSLVATLKILEAQAVAKTTMARDYNPNTTNLGGRSVWTGGKPHKIRDEIKRDYERTLWRMEDAMYLIYDKWGLELSPKPVEVDDHAAFERLPLANVPGKLTKVGVLGWIFLNAVPKKIELCKLQWNRTTHRTTFTYVNGVCQGDYPRMDELWERNNMTLHFGRSRLFVKDQGQLFRSVTGHRSNHPRFGSVADIKTDAESKLVDAIMTPFLDARTAVVEPLALAVLFDYDAYESVFKKHASAKRGDSDDDDGSDIVDKIKLWEVATRVAVRTFHGTERNKDLVFDPAAPDPKTLAYAEHTRRVAAPTALVLYLLASVLITTTPGAAGGYCVPGPIKSMGRMIVKVLEKYNSFRPCRDVARCTVHFPTLHAVLAFLEALAGSGLAFIVRVKNRFRRSYNAMMNGGYRDIQLHLLIPDGGGSVVDGIRDKKIFRYAELQVNLKAMVDIKNGAGRGHKLFNSARTIDAFGPHTQTFAGAQPSDHMWRLLAVGVIFEVDLTHYTLSPRDIQKLNSAIGSKQCRVHTLILAHCALRPKGGIALIGGLKENSSIEKIVLKENFLNDEFAVAFFNFLKSNTKITSVNLSENNELFYVPSGTSTDPETVYRLTNPENRLRIREPLPELEWTMVEELMNAVYGAIKANTTIIDLNLWSSSAFHSTAIRDTERIYRDWYACGHRAIILPSEYSDRQSIYYPNAKLRDEGPHLMSTVSKMT